MFVNRLPWVLILLAWMGGATWWHVCKIKLLCGNSPAPAVSVANPMPRPVPAPTTRPAPALRVTDGDQFRFDAPGNFSFARSGATANPDGVGALLDSLTAYLRANPGKTLTINGYYAGGETNPTRFANLGLGRAEDIKRAMKQRGIPADGLLTQGIETTDLTFSAKGDSLYGGLAFSFGQGEAITTDPTSPTAAPALLTERVTEEELANKEKFTSVFKPIDLYFPLSKADYIRTGETTRFFDEALAYLAKNGDKQLVLTGHTDNTGPDEVNRELSRDRANAVKVQLRRAGISPDQIRVEARGEAEPKADNSTLSGRKANRRVTIVVR